MIIRSLFDPNKDIYRTIEKVITYGAAQEVRLKAEISEYVVTEHIEEQFRKLLELMQLAMESGGSNEVGVWVSGFYGSGKSSFTKYFGLTFDNQCNIGGTPFIIWIDDPKIAQIIDSTTQFGEIELDLDTLGPLNVTGARLWIAAQALAHIFNDWPGSPTGRMANADAFNVRVGLAADLQYRKRNRPLRRRYAKASPRPKCRPPPAAEARRLVERFEWHYTPKHGSWLDLAESELGVLSAQCLDRRIPDKQTLIEEIAAWEHDRNANHTKADWQFTTQSARVKLKYLYPSI